VCSCFISWENYEFFSLFLIFLSRFINVKITRKFFCKSTHFSSMNLGYSVSRDFKLYTSSNSTVYLTFILWNYFSLKENLCCWCGTPTRKWKKIVSWSAVLRLKWIRVRPTSPIYDFKSRISEWGRDDGDWPSSRWISLTMDLALNTQLWCGIYFRVSLQ